VFVLALTAAACSSGTVMRADLRSASLDPGEPALRSAPGGMIAFARSNPSGIWLMLPDGSSQVRVASVPGSRQPAWSPDGTHLVFTAAGDDDGSDLWTLDLSEAGASPVQLTHGRHAEHPSWSPGGDRIVFDSTADGYLWLVRTDGTGLTRLTAGNHRDVSPVWSPDATHVAFIRSSATRTQELHVILVDRGDVYRDHPVQFRTSPVWSGDLRLVAVLGRGAKRHVEYGSDPPAPSWNPMFLRAGTQLAFLTTTATGGTALEVVGPPAPRTQRLPEPRVLDPAVDGFDLAWQPSGRCLNRDLPGRVTCAEAIRKARAGLYEPPAPPVTTWALRLPRSGDWLVRFEGYTNEPHSQPFPPKYPCESGATDVYVDALTGKPDGGPFTGWDVPCPPG